ncbi:hypothetical protein [Leptolyngbya sp. NIES-2104]|uniref:hypothetical protein n=1 Tax=Leptolyngbya sp. NIES-2104 TaxID=1552121 RepID=UPI00192CEEEE|nr:hypothetical protein [Leptolyngbya sp. NIES-2104]
MSYTEIDWQPFLDRLQYRNGDRLPVYPGNLKADLLAYSGLTGDAQGEMVYQLAVEISRLTTCCEPEIIYWFSRLIRLTTASSAEVDRQTLMIRNI